MASLLILKGPSQGHRVELDGETCVLGRNPDCDVIVPGNAVSRQHAQILRVDKLFFLEDLQSRNRTYVNNQPVTGRIRLRENDRIKICDFLCTFHELGTRPLLPPDLRRDPEASDDDDGGPEATVTSTLDAGSSSNLIMETQSAEKLKILLEITNSLSRTLQLDPLLPEVIENLFRIFRQADRGFVVLRDETAPHKLVPKTIRTRRDRDEATARFSRRIVNQCIETGQAILSEDASSDQRFSLSQSISDFRIRSVMCAPLRLQDGKVFGVIQLDTQDRSKKFVPDDLQLLVAVSNQAAVAMERAKLHEDMLARERMEREMQFAKEVQRGFLPARLPELPGYEFFAHYKAALAVGGDFYNFVRLPNERLAVLAGDVAGKGVPAALLMAKLSADARYCLLTEPDPAVAITSLNDQLHEAGLADRFVTFLVAVLDTHDHSITIVNAGHLSPIIRRAETGMVEEIAGGDLAGLPLGVVENVIYRSCRFELQPGDGVVLCTDGVTEAMNAAEEPFGMDRVVASMPPGTHTPGQLGNYVLRALVQHMAGQPQHDDITLVCFGRSSA